VGIWKDLKEIQKTWKEDRVFSPVYSKTMRDESLVRWNNAIGKVTYQN
jgi:glycerol kinase